jgi:hypothetical protein
LHNPRWEDHVSGNHAVGHPPIRVQMFVSSHSHDARFTNRF